MLLSLYSKKKYDNNLNYLFINPLSIRYENLNRPTGLLTTIF